jgi:hypothetical protein
MTFFSCRQTPSPTGGKQKEKDYEGEDEGMMTGIGGTPMSPTLIQPHGSNSKLKGKAMLEHYISFVGSAQNFRDVDVKQPNNIRNSNSCNSSQALSKSSSKKKRKQEEDITPRCGHQVPLLRPSTLHFYTLVGQKK